METVFYPTQNDAIVRNRDGGFTWYCLTGPEVRVFYPTCSLIELCSELRSEGREDLASAIEALINESGEY